MAAVVAKVLELKGGADTDNVYLGVDASEINDAEAGATLEGEVLPTPVDGLSFLFVSPSEGAPAQFAFPVHELEGDEPTTLMFVQVPKSVLPADATHGTTIEGNMINRRGGGTVLVFALEEAPEPEGAPTA